MEKKNIGMKVAIIILSILVLVLGGFIFYEHLLINNIDNNDSNGQLNQDSQNLTNDFSKNDLKKIIDDQLWILFRKDTSKIENISNNDKLLLALGLLEDKYLTNTDNVDTTFVDFSSEELEKAFNNSVISNLGIKHESFDIYNITGDDDWYNREESLLLYSKSMYNYHIPHASIVKDFKKNGNKYTIYMNYLFADDMVGTQYYHGSITDALDEKNSIVKAYDDEEYIDAQKYLDDNYSKIKDNLATYTYVFELKNDKLLLTDFSIK